MTSPDERSQTALTASMNAESVHGELSSRVFRKLGSWSPAMPVTDHATPDEIEAACRDAELALTPASGKEFMVAMGLLGDFAVTFGLTDGDLKAAQSYYRDALCDLPADLLAVAIKRTTANWRFGRMMPLPADIRGQVSEEFAQRQHARRRLGMASQSWQRDVRERREAAARPYKPIEPIVYSLVKSTRMPETDDEAA